MTTLQEIRQALNSLIIGRSELIDLVLVAAIARQPVFIGGPPGEGKTYLINQVARCFEADYGYCLFSQDTTKDEFLGPVDVVALTNERKFQRSLKGGLADSHFYCADEIGRSNSTARNAQLSAINEGFIRVGTESIQTKLRLYAGLSNSLLGSPKEHDAFWDRFTLRYWVSPLARQDREILMEREAGIKRVPKLPAPMSLTALDELHEQIASVNMHGQTINKLNDIAELAASEGVFVSTRKLNQCIGLLKAHALVQGREVVEWVDLIILKHIFWDTLQQRSKVADLVWDNAQPVNSKALKELRGKARDKFQEAMGLPSTQVAKKSIAMAEIRMIAEQTAELTESTEHPDYIYVTKLYSDLREAISC